MTQDDLKEQIEKLTYTIKMHHNFYKCLPRSVHHAHIESVRSTYRDFLKSAFSLINELKVQGCNLPAELDAFETRAKHLWWMDNADEHKIYSPYESCMQLKKEDV